MGRFWGRGILIIIVAFVCYIYFTHSGESAAAGFAAETVKVAMAYLFGTFAAGRRND